MTAFFDAKIIHIQIPVYMTKLSYVVQMHATIHCANQQEQYPRPIFVSYLVHFGYAMTLNIWVISRCTRGKRLRMPKLEGHVVILIIAVLGFLCVTAWTFSLQVRTSSVNGSFHACSRAIAAVEYLIWMHIDIDANACDPETLFSVYNTIP